MDEKMKMELEKVKESKKKLVCFIESVIDSGKECVFSEIDGFGKLVDAAKDLAELEEKCVKAAYYEQIIKAMKEAEDEDDDETFGYNNRRYASGRYAPRGRGHYGYEPMDDGMVDDMRMGYSSGSGGRSSSSGGRGRSGGNSGNMNSGRSSGGRSSSGGSYGYEPWSEMYNPVSMKGKFYEDWDMARKHYHESGDPESKKKMNEHMSHNITEVVSQLQEMSMEADPEMKKELKTKLSKLMEDMNRMI